MHGFEANFKIIIILFCEKLVRSTCWKWTEVCTTDYAVDIVKNKAKDIPANWKPTKWKNIINSKNSFNDKTNEYGLIAEPPKILFIINFSFHFKINGFLKI